MLSSENKDIIIILYNYYKGTLYKGTGSWCVLVEYVKENYYARFHDPSYHRYREINC